MMKIFKSIPGYRSGKGWKIVISTIYYALSVLIAAIVEDISITLILLSFPFILFGFMSLVKQKKPLLFIIGILALIIGFVLFGAAEDGETMSGTQLTVNPTPTIEAAPTAEPIPTPTVEATAEPVHEATEISSEFSAEEWAEMEENDRKEKERSDFIASCYTAPYDDLARNPEYYKNNHISVRGKVLQYQESGLNVTMLIQITQKDAEWDIWDDLVYVTYTKNSALDSRWLEGDIVSVYGVYQGIKSYETTIGGTNQVPYIQAKYIL